MRMGLMFLVLGLTASVAAAEERFVTPEAMGTWSIVCTPTATESERYAAGEFQSLFEAMTSRKLPVVEKAPAGGAVFIGTEAVAQSGQTMPALELGEEGLRIGIFEKCICIDGGRPRGTLYGVHEFFEELCGVRYLTHDQTYIPENARTCKIPLGTRSYVPPFAFRWSYYGENSSSPAFAARLHTNTVSDDPKLGGRTGYRLVSHNVANLLPPAKYAATHPEYYALVDGRRMGETGGGGPQLCATNPEVLELVTQATLEEIKNNPTAKNVYIAQMDNDAYCTCPNCAALDAREESHAASTLALVNAVAERVEKVHPDVLIGTFAYLYSRTPPKTMRARHNVLIQLCSIECCDYHAIDDADCPLNRQFCEDVAGWKTKADNIFIWHYNVNFGGFMLPFPNLRSIGRSVDYFFHNNCRGVFMQAAGGGFSTELSDLRNYVMSRCLWKPGRDSWKETEEFCRLHYREAAPAILEYLTALHDRVGRQGTHPTCFPRDADVGIDPQSAREILNQFQKALAAAKSEEVRTRVEKASLCAYRAVLQAASMPMGYAEGVCRAELSGYEPGLFDRYVALCQRFGVTMDDEAVSNASFLDEYRKDVAGVPAVRLENETWRVTLLPGMNGRFYEMLYKPTGRNVVPNLRRLARCHCEDWVQQGQGPSLKNVVPFEVQPQGNQVQGNTAELIYTAPDGSRLVRRVSLVGDAIRVEMQATAGAAQTFEFYVHPEYDTVSKTIDPKLLSVYVKAPQWTLANRDWGKFNPTTEAQQAALAGAVAGGAFAYYQHEAGFGVEQRFDPQPFRALGIFWRPNQRQISLKLLTPAVRLEKGERTGYSYEIRYLDKPPIAE